MLCSSPKVGGEGSTMAETKKTPNIVKDGPVKAYDLPRQIEDTSSHNQGKKKSENDNKKSKMMNRTFSQDNEKI